MMIKVLCKGATKSRCYMQFAVVIASLSLFGGPEMRC